MSIADIVDEQLAEDYSPAARAWVKTVQWSGPEAIPLDQIDMADAGHWGAAKDKKKVDKFAKKIARGKLKPAIFVREPHKTKLRVVDGHHRTLANKSLGRPVMAYVATVQDLDGPWNHMHSSSDVSVPSVGFMQPAKPPNPKALPPPRWPLSQVNMISAAKRKSLPDAKFAIPEKKAYPIDTAARVRNAAARLEQNKSRLSSAEYKSARARIASAAKKFGIHSEYNASSAQHATDMVTPHMHVQAVIPHGGHLHVRHLSEDRSQVLALDDEGGEYFAIATLLDDVGASDGPIWNQVACVGAFKGHPAGPFELNETVFNEIIKNWEAGGRRPIPVDYEHASEADATAGSIPSGGAPAQAWITDLKADAKGLYGLFDDWDPTARQYVKTKRYRFFSPAIRFGSRDKVTGRPIGARLTSGALTNQPFLDNLPALKARTPTGELIAAKDTGGEQVVTMQGIAESDHAPSHHFVTPSHEYMPKLKACLGLHPLATTDEMKDHLDRLRDHLAKAGGNVNATHAGVSLASYIHPLRSLTHGDAAGVTAEQIFETVEHMIDAAIAEHEAVEHGEVEERLEHTASMATAIESDKGGQQLAGYADHQPAAVTADDNVDDGGDATMSDKALQTENDTLKVKLATQEAELHTLRDKVAKLEKQNADRDAADRAADVEYALTIHADKVAHLGDTDDDRKSILMRFREQSPEVFAASFPKDVAPQHAHLLRQQVQQNPGHDPSRVVPPEVEEIILKGEDVRATSSRLMSEKKLSFRAAAEEALRLHNIARQVA